MIHGQGQRKKEVHNRAPLTILPHPLDGQGALITAEVFNGDNYDLWEKVVQTALKSKNKLGFIGRTLKKLEIKEVHFTEYHPWDMVNSRVCSWLFNVIERKLCPSVAYAKMFKAMWEDLQK